MAQTEMKTLIVVDPYKIRGHWHPMLWVAQKYSSMIAEAKRRTDPFEARLFCCRDISSFLQDCGVEKALLYSPTDSVESAHFNKRSTKWDRPQIAKWINYLGDHNPTDSHPLISQIDSIRRSYDFDGIVYWGTNRALKEYSAKASIPILFCELGPLRPPFGFAGTMDANGVNGDSFTAKLRLSDLPGTEGGSFSLFEPASARSRRMTFLVALQNADDTNVLLHRNGIGYEDFILDTVKELSLLDYVIVAPHPGAYRYRYSYLRQLELISTLSQLKNVRILRRGERTADALETIDGAVCFNSSVGFETVLKRRPVSIGGRASYALAGVSTSLANMRTSVCRPTTAFARYIRLLERYYVTFDELFDVNGIKRGFARWTSINSMSQQDGVSYLFDSERNLELLTQH